MITGGKINAVEAKRLKEGQVTGLAVNIDVTDLKEDGNALAVSYTFTIHYNPEIAEMKIHGELQASEDPASRKKIMEEWKKSKTMLPSFAEDVLTAMNYAATATGTLLAYAINVGAPINTPRARVGPPEGEKKKQGKAAG